MLSLQLRLIPIPREITRYLEAFFDLVQELFPAQEDELPPAKMPKFAVQADDAAKAPEPVSNDLTETLFDRIRQPPILRVIADRPSGFWHFPNISDSQHVLIIVYVKGASARHEAWCSKCE